MKKKYLNKSQYPTPYPRHARDLIKMIVDKEAEMMSPSVMAPIPTNMVRHIPTKSFTGIFSFINYQVHRILP